MLVSRFGFKQGHKTWLHWNPNKQMPSIDPTYAGGGKLLERKDFGVLVRFLFPTCTNTGEESGGVVEQAGVPHRTPGPFLHALTLHPRTFPTPPESCWLLFPTCE